MTSVICLGEEDVIETIAVSLTFSFVTVFEIWDLIVVVVTVFSVKELLIPDSADKVLLVESVPGIRGLRELRRVLYEEDESTV